MKYSITAPRVEDGVINLPTSKSISNRLLLLSAICGGGRLPDALSDCDDTNVMLAALRSDLSHVDVGAAGTSMRFLTAYLATIPGQHIITGSERMKQRPIAVLVDALRSLGASISYLENEGCPPLKIIGGGLRGGKVSLPGDVSSQYISALMMVGPTLSGGLEIELSGKMVSVPYIEMTRGLMRSFGVDVSIVGNHISVPQMCYSYRQMRVEADWSAASYWYQIAALCPGRKFKLMGLSHDSLQGDSACASIASKYFGVQSSFLPDGVVISSPMNAVSRTLDYDFSNQPDLAQAFVALSCFRRNPIQASGLESLRIKETDRLEALKAELHKVGCDIQVLPNCNVLYDGNMSLPQSDAVLQTYKDHRMAMCMAPAAILGRQLLMDDPAVVSKSYPRFWDDLMSVGFLVENV